jgi:UDP-N-acetylmuramoyl-L-alanyl-D-glutamate--2,6-diaminopimelate ligase
MKLSELIREFQYSVSPASGDTEITGIVSDSRLVQAGNLFVALIGGAVDGHRYIPAAIERGASAVVGMEVSEPLDVPYIRVPDSRTALPRLAAAYFGFPARKLTMIGVTGTDGKTTTTNMIYQILKAAGHKTGMISTINAVIGDQSLDTGYHVTTPDAPDVQRYLAQMVADGITHVVLEVTSHGLSQGRVDACEFDVAVVTNITHEHLDYHRSYEEYRSAKARLLTGLSTTVQKTNGNPRMAVLNRDDASFEYLSQVATGSVLSYGFRESADILPAKMQRSSDGLRFVVTGKGMEFPLVCPLLGDFNVYNCLAAVSSTVYTLNVDPDAAQAGLSALRSVPGRMEKIAMGQEFTAIVDFAHTPNALKVALETAHQITPGRVIAVFGAAGLRDRQKRRMMAETSVKLADLTILTAEDPRTEKLDDILDEMAAGARDAGGIEGETFWRVPDRGEALRFAVSMTHVGDVVISCGKGHEQSMCFGDTEYPWDDRAAMRAALAERLSLSGYPMPYLPTQDS